MGFYGNIANTSLTHFQFDEEFSNRRDMDEAAAKGTDGVFQGRFVLVRYDPEGAFFESDILSGYKKDNDDAIYLDNACTIPYLFTDFTPVNTENLDSADWDKYYKKTGIYYFPLPNAHCFDAQATDYYMSTVEGNNNLVYAQQILRIRNPDGYLTSEYYICTGESSATTHIATFDLITVVANPEDTENLPDYIKNYMIDKQYYGVGFDWRSYDATIWQKIYQEGIGKFILIARLNAAMPGIQLVEKAPSLDPSFATIRAQSDALYQIEVPGHWGLQIKEATAEEGEIVKSDQKWIRTDNSTNPPTETEIDADIYMNLTVPVSTGDNEYSRYSHAERQYKEDTIQNEIIFDLTGESGKVYYDSQGVPNTKDKIELGIHVPAIGNMIDDGYDLLYGVDEETGIRPRDINWYDGDQTTLKTTGNVELGGKTYNLNTLAGSLNVIHDKLGQIIVKRETEMPQSTLRDYSMNNIYYIEENDKYYRIGTDYEYTPLQNSYYTFEEAPEALTDYLINTYYISNNATDANPTFTVSLTELTAEQIANGYKYYKRNIASDIYTPITLTPYSPNHYYYITGVDYILDQGSQPTALSQKYYEIYEDNENEVKIYPWTYFNGEYLPSRYFYTTEVVKTEDEEEVTYNLFYLDTNNDPVADRVYYEVIETTSYNNKIFYQPGVFYTQNINGGFDPITYTKFDDPQDPEHSFKHYFSNQDQIYWLEFDETISNVTSYTDAEGTHVILTHPLKENGSHAIYVSSIAELPADTSSLYYKYNNNYIPFNIMTDYIIADSDIPNFAVQRDYAIIEYSIKDKLYTTYTYYYKDENNGSYILSGDRLDAHDTYYKILVTHEVEYPFYLPNTYYYNPEGIYIKDPNATMRENTQYYTKTVLYVMTDSSGRCPHGYEWNDQALYVPASIVLGTRNEILRLIEINNVVDGDFSINGNLLLLEKYLEKNNEDTRDTNTFRGCLNILHDYLYMFRKIIPHKLVYVNDFGQISSALDIDYDKLKWLVSHKNDIEELINNNS